jgi:hypothetical protein
LQTKRGEPHKLKLQSLERTKTTKMPTLFNTATAETSSTPVAEETEVRQVDWDAEVVADHPDADLNELLPIPPAGIYLFKSRLLPAAEGKENPYGSVTKDNKPFISAMVELELVDESSPFNGYKLNHRLSSLVFEKRGTSPLHHFMNCIGEVVPTVIRMRDFRDKVVSALESTPMVQAELEWRAARKSGPGQYDWEDVAKKMRDFPKDKESDGYSQIYLYTNPTTKQKSEHRAQAYISKFLLQQ